MKTKLSKTEARERIEEFFSKNDFKPEEVKKMKRLAMKHRISLKEERKKFCKNCLRKLKGKIRVSKIYKTVACESCGHINRIKM